MPRQILYSVTMMETGMPFIVEADGIQSSGYGGVMD